MGCKKRLHLPQTPTRFSQGFHVSRQRRRVRRNSKLPNPKEIGNAGSFFKNPIVEIHTINKIKIDYDDLVYFEGNKGFKIPAAWLIEKSGWKGYKKENIGISNKHALVLVNYGTKSGEKLKELSIKIMEDVKNKFGIKLEPEVNII